MIERLLEAFFRHLVLIVLPLVVIPLDVAAFVLSTPAQYEASAGMWVEQATYLNYSTDDINRYLPPSQNQKNRLVELMQTKSFVADIARNTNLASLAKAPDGDALLKEIFARDFDVSANGDHLLTFRFRAEDRDLAVAVLDSTVAVFKNRAASDRFGQAQVAITFYQSRFTDAENKLASARAALAKYVTDNPSVAATVSRAGIQVASVDPQFADLQRRVDASQRDADAARASLEKAELDVSAGEQGLELGFRIVDPVEPSLSPSRQLKKVLIYPIVAVLAGLMLSAALLLLFALSDHSIRSLADFAPETVILGVLPPLRPKGVRRGAGPNATRRAIGYVAGSVIALARTERKAS
jgi:uncharacterized protein involved in exopolysaccharide biosynthesis